MTVVGIDFGTTNSCMSYINAFGHPTVIPNPEGYLTTPTCVYFDLYSSDILCGFTAYELHQSPRNSLYIQNIITNFKRLVGVTYEEYINNQSLQHFFNRKGNVIVQALDSPFCAVQLTHDNTLQTLSIDYIVTLFLRYLKQIADNTLGHGVNEIVITVPAYFTDLQRCHIKEACEKVGMHVLRIINEPTAAALAYGFEKIQCEPKSIETVLVVDCGGGTTDVSLLIMDYEEQIFEVRNVKGDNFLGGEDLTHYLATFVLQELKLENPTPKQLNKIKVQCENVKQQLSFNQSVSLLIENLYSDKDVCMTLTREKFIHTCDEFFNKIESLVYDTTIGYKLDKIVFVGGTTRIPYLNELCHRILCENITLCNTIDPDQTVSIGAAVQGYFLNSHEDDHNDVTVLDVIPMSLGVETMGGLMSTIVSKNTHIPVSKTQIFTNSEDHITQISIQVYQGDRRLVRDNVLLASFVLDGLNQEYKRGEMNIKVVFNVDADGILTVDAEESKSNSHTSIKVKKVASHCDNANDNFEDDFVFGDAYKSNQILAKLELYDMLKYLLTNFHDNKANGVIEVTEIQDMLLNTLLNKAFDAITNFQQYSPQELQEFKSTLERDYHNILLLESNIIDKTSFGSTEII